MRTLPPKMVQALAPFAPLFSKRVWQHAQVLLVGAILAPGKRTVSFRPTSDGFGPREALPSLPPGAQPCQLVEPEGRVASLLGLLVEAFVPEGSPLVVGIDETLERRYGRKISARGVYRDPVRSTHETFVKSSGLRWVCAMLLVEVPWASRVWALPFLSALAPSERYAARRGKRHKKITEWAWQMLLVLRRWYPQARDSGRGRPRLRIAQAARPLPQAEKADHLHHPPQAGCRPLRTGPATAPGPEREASHQGRAPAQPFRGGPRSRKPFGRPPRSPTGTGAGSARSRSLLQTAVWYSTGLPAVPVRWVLIRDPEGGFKTQALLCTDLEADPEKIVSLVRDALAAGGDLPGGAQAPGIRDAEAVVGVWRSGAPPRPC